jgi:tetratricopeptide (TPR) repeat protein
VSFPLASPLTKTHSVAAVITGVALVATAIAPGHDVALVWFIAALPLLASLTAIFLQGAAWNRHLLAVVGVEIAVLIVVPRLYIHARCQSDAARVVELAQQSRIGEAQVLAHHVLALSPNATWKGNSLKLAADNLDREARIIEDRVAVPVSPSARFSERLARVRDLAILGRTSEALQVLNALPSAINSPVACNLSGTIHESRSDWRKAREWYGRSKDGWLQQEHSEQRTAGLVQAVTGIAFSERKQGRLREAEAAWNERLELEPTAESHFLLAQFYEDTQQAQKARFHAQEAIRLEPDRYTQHGRRLLDKLVTSHFGCLGVFSAEASPSTPFGAATIGKQ